MCTDVRKGTSWWVKIVRWVNRRSNQGWAEVFLRLESCVAPFSAENYKEDSTWPTKTAENYISSLHFLGFRLICCGQLSCMLSLLKRKEGKDCCTLWWHLLWIYASMKLKNEGLHGEKMLWRVEVLRFCAMSRHCGVSFGAMFVEWWEWTSHTLREYVQQIGWGRRTFSLSQMSRTELAGVMLWRENEGWNPSFSRVGVRVCCARAFQQRFSFFAVTSVTLVVK